MVPSFVLPSFSQVAAPCLRTILPDASVGQSNMQRMNSVYPLHVIAIETDIRQAKHLNRNSLRTHMVKSHKVRVSLVHGGASQGGCLSSDKRRQVLGEWSQACTTWVPDLNLVVI
jgi:hypothetical protein